MPEPNEELKSKVGDWQGFATDLTPIIVSEEEYEWLCRQLDAPPRDLPRLRELLQKKPIWQEDD